MTKKMLIDATHPEETRVVVLDGNKVDNFDFESINKKQLAGNIYLAKVTRVEPSLQAAFVDYGGNRHGFLAFAEIHPDYYQIPVADREAILAEEEREVAAEAEAEAAEAGDPPKRRSRSRKSKQGDAKQDEDKKAASTSEASAETTGEAAKPRRSRRKKDQRHASTSGGLDVIDLSAEEPAEEGGGGPLGAPHGQAPAASAEDRAAPVPETAGGEAAEPAEGPQGDDAGPAGGTAGTPLGSGDASPAEEGAGAEKPAGPDDEASGGGSAGSRSMPESTGLDDEAVSEDVDGSAGEDKPRARRARGGRSGKSGRSGRSKRGEEAEPVAGSAGTAQDTDTADTEEGDLGEPGEVETAGAEDIREEVTRERAIRRRRYKIQDVIKVRQILLVQVVKEERGNKGAALTTYLSLAGRYCVLMPNTARGGGISRKISNAPDRKRLREIVGAMEVPRGMGLIVRTAGAERTRPEIKRDYEFLLRQWEQIRELTLNSIAPTLIYEEGSLIKRSIRDLYSKEIDSVLVEGEAGYKEAKAYMKMLMPSHARHVKQYADQVPLFIRYQVESYLNAMFSPVVQLKSGGYIVIGVTEALVAIDVNSGRSTKQGSVEDTAVKTNLEAADEVARQLRLRDLAGLIVIDFIDMDERRNNASVEKRMKERLKTDRARIQIGRISAFGLMEMSRQRLRPGMLEASTKPCPHCHGTGTIRSDDSLALAILREVEEQAIRNDAAELTVTTPVGIANFLINAKRAHVAMVEERHGVSVAVYGDPAMTSPDFRVERARAKPRVDEAATQTVTAESASASSGTEAPATAVPAATSAPSEAPARAEVESEDEASKARRRRGKRGGRRRRVKSDEREDTAGETEGAAREQEETGETVQPDGQPEEATPTGSAEAGEAQAKPRSRSTRGRRSRSRTKNGSESSQSDENGAEISRSGAASAEPETPSTPAVPQEPAEPAGQTEPAAGVVDKTAPAESAAHEAADAPGPAEAPAETTGGATSDDGASPEGEGDGSGDAAPSGGEAEPTGPGIAKTRRRGWWTLGF